MIPAVSVNQLARLMIMWLTYNVSLEVCNYSNVRTMRTCAHGLMSATLGGPVGWGLYLRAQERTTTEEHRSDVGYLILESKCCKGGRGGKAGYPQDAQNQAWKS